MDNEKLLKNVFSQNREFIVTEAFFALATMVAGFCGWWPLFAGLAFMSLMIPLWFIAITVAAVVDILTEADQ